MNHFSFTLFKLCGQFCWIWLSMTDLSSGAGIMLGCSDFISSIIIFSDSICRTFLFLMGSSETRETVKGD